MSEVFEGILCAAQPDRLGAMVVDLSPAGAPRGRSPAYRTRELTPLLSAAFVTNPRAQGSFLEETAHTASVLSRALGKALLVAYDTRVSCRVAVLAEGEVAAEFGEEDELFVPLREDGTPNNEGLRLRFEELDPTGEYETVVNAVQLGLQHFGHPEAWAALRELISAQGA